MSADSPVATPPAPTPATPAAPKRKLGRGLGALLGDARREEPIVRTPASMTPAQTAPAAATPSQAAAQTAANPASEGLAVLPIANIEPHPEQPRTHFDEEALAELAASIESRGVIQPIIVRPMPGGKYQLVAGERRWRAAQKAKLTAIPAIVRTLEERDVAALALIENIQREQLNPIEEARAYQRLAEREDMTQADIARMVDKSRSHVANMQRLLSLPNEVLSFVEEGKLDMGHARALVGREDAVDIASKAVAKGLSVREVEKLTRKSAEPREPKKPRTARESTGDADIEAVQNHLEEILGLPVRISTDVDPRSGSVTISYRTLDQLDLVCQRLTGGGI